MPNWVGKWEGGRYYLDEEGRKVFFIERRVEGRQRSFKLETHDDKLAVGELANFVKDPVKFARPPEVPPEVGPIYITTARINRYLVSIHKSVKDHRDARRSYLLKWSAQKIDLRTADRRTLRAALAEFDGGHRGRVEALNAFCNWLVREEELPKWTRFKLPDGLEPEQTRAERRAYSLEELAAAYQRLEGQANKDVFFLRAATGIHHTELEQVLKCKVYEGPLPDRGVGLRKLGGTHEIAGVLQVMHKSRHRHRQSLTAPMLAAALRLREHVPHRMTMWKALDPLVPSNLRHTFITLAGEVGQLVTYGEGGVDRARVAQLVGHRAGSTMTADRYEKMQVPPLVKLPLGWGD